MTQNFDPSQILDDGQPMFVDEEEQLPPPEQEQEDESQYLITLDRRQLQNQMLELLNNEPEARHIFSRAVGNKAAERYKPQIDELRKSLSDYQFLLRKAQIASLPEEEITRRLREDSNFARTYVAVKDFDRPEPQISDTISESDQQSLVASVRSIVSIGREQGLSDEDLAEIATGLQSGKYDVDETGTPIPASQWRETLTNLQRDVTERLVKRHTNGNAPSNGVVPSNEVPPTTQPPQRDTARPDISNPGNRGVRTNRMTMREFKALPIDKQIEMFPRDGMLEAAVESGQIIVEGLND